jgi:hypothetical protein
LKWEGVEVLGHLQLRFAVGVLDKFRSGQIENALLGRIRCVAGC